MTPEGIISALLIGAVIGVVARLLLPGKQDIPLWLTVLVGAAAAVIGTLIVGSLQDTEGLDWVEILVQIVVAMIGVGLVSSLRSGSRSRGRGAARR